MAPPSRSIQRTLLRAMLLTSFAVLFLTCGAFVVYELVTFRREMVRHMSTRSKMMAANCTGSLAFQNIADGTEVLATLSADHDVTMAAIYDKEGRLFAKFPPDLSDGAFPASPKDSEPYFADSHLRIFTPIVQNGKRLGTFYLNFDLRAMRERFRLYGVIVVMVMACAALLAWTISSKLLRQISQPILSLAESVRVVSETKDYSVRARKFADDEMGQLADGFNAMLARVQARDAELRENEQRLRELADAMPHGGILRLEVSNFVCDETFVAQNAEARLGPHVCISVKDTGIGIPPHVLARMFEPFFTTKAMDKGTGLGLSTVAGILNSHHGFVKVQTALNCGTEFRVYLPAQKSSAAALDGIQRHELPVGRGEVVLIVDDEAAIVNISKQTLEAFGYQVLTASDGAEAIGLCARQGMQVKLMLTDMMMPGLDGTATINGVRRVAPQIKIIAASGLGCALVPSGPNQPQVDAFLQKPYTTEHLLRTVHRVLRREGLAAPMATGHRPFPFPTS